ncbi:MAG: hypothetical protein K940chlam2_00018 [Chlamydiae bacterium]|nr:hypothetical protein [Chlamydiota bacterium]
MNIIMAQGQNNRWLEGNPAIHGLPERKHLVSINGRANLLRTFEMLNETAVVVGWPEYSAHFQSDNLISLDDPGMLANGMLQTKDLWGSKRTTFLLGDVIWSRASLDEALKPHGKWHMMVREQHGSSERYSLSVNAEMYDHLIMFLGYNYRIGRLLDIRRWFSQQFPVHMSTRVSRIHDFSRVREVGDWTDDFDTVEEWLKHGPSICGLAEQEDLSSGL